MKKIPITIRLSPSVRKALRVLTKSELQRTETAIVELALRNLFTTEPWKTELRDMQKFLTEE